MENLVSTEVIGKLSFKCKPHLNLYKVSWLQKGHRVNVSKQCFISFHIGTYHDRVLCNVVPMDAFHLLLGRPWQYDWRTIHDAMKNTFLLEKDGSKIKMFPMKEEKEDNNNNNNHNSGRRVMLCSFKELLKEERKAKCCFVILSKNLSLEMKKIEILEKVEEFLIEFKIVISEELPMDWCM